MIGRSIGRFRVLASLGQGGMSSVWRARDELLGREVALKILSETLAQSDDARRRFRHEALIAAGLDHPGIAAVYDSGETGDATWIAMALIEGETLAERLARSLVPVAQVVAIGTAVADALGYAHERGVVHRDVTSRNVMLGKDGRIFVLDFGLALAQGTSRISSSGTMVGTAPYMAPELLAGATATPASDLYGLGVVMYEALTGTLPFAEKRGMAAMFAVLNLTPSPIRELRPEVSAELESAVQRCMARDPGARFSSATELAATLRSNDAAPMEASPAETPAAVATTSAVAERLASGSGVIYLAIPPFDVTSPGGAEAVETRAIARGLESVAAAGLSEAQRLHVIRSAEAPSDDSPEGLRAFARDAGAHLLLLGSVRRSGSRIRLVYALWDSEAGLQVEGDALEGSSLDAFDLEDRMLASLRRALARGRLDSRETRARPSDPAAGEHYRQALRYMERHDHEASVDGALALLERLIESAPEEARYRAMHARACVMKYELTRQRTWQARAAAAASEAAALAPDAAETLLALADVHRTAGRLADAEREYGLALAQRPDYYEALLGRALTVHNMGRHEEAERDCLRAITLSPNDWRGHNVLGWSRYTLGRYSEARESLLRVLDLAPDSALGWRNLGNALYQLDRFDEAASIFQRAVEFEPSAPAYSNLGTVLFSIGDYPGSIEAMERAVALNPSDPVMWGNLGNACRLVPDRRGRAVEALERAIGLMREQLQRDSGNAESWGRLAGWLANLERRSEAMDAIGEALRRDCENVQCMVRAVHVFWQLGERDEAFQWVDRALRSGYGVGRFRSSPDLVELIRDPQFQRLSEELSASAGRPAPGPNGREESR